MPTSIPLLRVITILLVLFAVAIITPLIALASHNHPSPADDYCFANTALRYGFWEAQRLYYNGWSGRFFQNLIVHINPLMFGWYAGYKIYPIVLLALLMSSCYALASQWLYFYFGTEVKLAVMLGLFVGFITTLSTISEYLYWYTGMATYSLPSILFLFLLAVMMAHQRSGFGWKSGYVLSEVLLATAIIGSSEMTMVLVLSVLSLIAFGELLQRRRLSVTILILLAVSVVGGYFMMKAPGNAVRLGSNSNSSNLALTLVSSLRYAARYVPHQLFLTPWLPLSLLYLPIAWKLIGSRRHADLPPYLQLHPLLGLLYSAATVLALISLHFYGVGIPPIPRLVNLVNLFFWLSWLYNLTLFVVLFRHRFEPARWQPYLRPVGLVALVWAIVIASIGPVLPLTYGDWLSGRAAQYDRAMQERYDQLAESSNPESLLNPLPTQPASLFLEDIHDDSQHLWNRCWADYFHKKTITLKTNRVSQHTKQ